MGMWEWLPPTSVKELQRFLGFANFYRQFSQDYSSYVANHISSSGPQKAFEDLKQHFTTAPILRHLDPNLPFIKHTQVESNR